MRKLKIQSPAARKPGWLSCAAIAFAAAFTIVIVWAIPAAAEHTRFWRESDYQQFDRGTAKGVALRSDGTIVLAPKFTPFADANLAYLWALRMDSRGNLYAAGGSDAKVIRLDGAGKATTVFESTEMTAQSLLLDKNDNLYVGTSPDGKVYKVTPDGQKSVFFDPKTKYIWDLAWGPDGTLYVATGDTGKIFAVAPDGKSETFYSSDETHISALALDGKGSLLAGTEPNGLVLRISLAPEPAAAAAKRAQEKRDADKQNDGKEAKDSGRSAYVLYETSKKEITALVPDGAGNLYVTAIGEKSHSITPLPQQANPALATPQQSATVSGGQNVTITVGSTTAANPQQSTPTNFSPFPPLTSTAVYRIAADGAPEEIWTDREDLVYAAGLSGDGSLLLGIGNQGAVVRLEGDGVFSRLAKTSSEQVTRFLRAPNGAVYVATANPGKIFTLGPELESEGSFASEPFDARNFSRWGNLTWWGNNTQGASASGVELYVRAGNTSDPENNWSAWSGPYRDPKGSAAQYPAARFVQWKAVLHGGKDAAPELSWVSVAYLPKNVAPRIDSVVLQDPGVRVSGFGAQQQSGTSQPAPVELRLPAAPSLQNPFAIPSPRQPGESMRFEPQPQGFAQKGFQAVLWGATDANDDELTYAIYYRGEGEKDWKLLKDKTDQKFYSWDTSSLPDGAYYLKIVASDAQSNPHGEALTAERESARFVIDNTPPNITGIATDSTRSGSDPSVTVHFRASDATSAIVRAQYSLDAGDWTIVLPGNGMSDSLDETYSITLPDVTPGEHTLSVRVYDQFDNVTAAKTTFNVPAVNPVKR